MASVKEQRKRLERTQIDAVVRDYQEQNRYGEITIKFQNGVMQLVQKTETMKM